MSQLLQSKLSAVRRKGVLVSSVTGMAVAVGAVILALAATMILDWWMNFPRWVRVVILAAEIVGLGYIVWRFVVGPVLFGEDDESIALAVEREVPSLGGRLIASVQLSRPAAVGAGASSSLVAATIDQAEGIAGPIDFTQVVKVDGLIRLAGIAAVIVVAGLIGFSLGGDSSRTLLRRAMGMSVAVPRKTGIECVSGNFVVARGEPAKLVAVAHGVVPRGGVVTMEFDSGATQQFPLDVDEDKPNTFSRTIDNVQESFRYRFALNDAESEHFTATAVLRPAVAQLQCQQVYPAYTKTGTVKRLPGDLSILDGSRLMLNVTANKKVKFTSPGDAKGNRVHLLGSNVDFPLEADINDTSRLTARDGIQKSIPLPKGTTGMTIHLIDEHGFESKDPAVYRIDLLPDKPPLVRVTSPERREELVTTAATINVGFDASDDFAIDKVAIKYKLTRGGAAVVEGTGGGDGLRADYFSNRDLAGAPVTRLAPVVDFDWGGGSPDPAIPGDNFSARWTGRIEPTRTDDYTFYTISDDGVRLWVDGQLIIDNWTDHRPTEDAGRVSLTAGKKVDIKMEFMENGGNAQAKLLWSCEGVDKQIVPQDRLYSAAMETRAPGVDAETRDAQIAAGERIASENLVGRWKFDEKSGRRASDSSRNQSTAILRGIAFLPGVLGNAASFDGMESQAMIANNDELNPTDQISITAWANANEWPGYRRIVQKGRHDNQYRLLSEGDRLKFELAGVGQVTATLPSAGVWHHIAGTYDGKTMTLYVDGQVVGSENRGGKINRTEDPVYIGTKFDAGQPIERFNGSVDDVRIYNRALSPEEIAVLNVPALESVRPAAPAGGDDASVRTIELNLDGQTPKSVRRRYELRPAELVPPAGEGTTIEYWIEVRDANNATGPGVGTSDHYFAHVVSESVKRAELMNRLGDYLGQIRNVTETQEDLNAKLGALIQGKSEGK